MKTWIAFISALFLFPMMVMAQEEIPSPTDKTEVGTDLNFYFLPDDFVLLPVVRIDKGRLHLEGRYNYEDLETVSLWAGYNFSGGSEVTFTITPMAGVIFGLSDGFAPGLEATVGYRSLEWYSESEYFIDPGTSENNFLYTWIDFTYSPLDWLWLGISAQRTRLYQSDTEIQRGLILGGGWNQWELTGYLYNPDQNQAVFLLTLSASF